MGICPRKGCLSRSYRVILHSRNLASGVDPVVETEKIETVRGWLLKAVQQQG
jgi:hypothetical protein